MLGAGKGWVLLWLIWDSHLPIIVAIGCDVAGINFVGGQADSLILRSSWHMWLTWLESITPKAPLRCGLVNQNTVHVSETLHFEAQSFSPDHMIFRSVLSTNRRLSFRLFREGRTGEMTVLRFHSRIQNIKNRMGGCFTLIYGAITVPGVKEMRLKHHYWRESLKYYTVKPQFPLCADICCWTSLQASVWMSRKNTGMDYVLVFQ